MYITAHRLRALGGTTGYNAFLYFHGDESIESLNGTREAYPPPSERSAAMVNIPEGGNQVDAYLDVVGPDNTSPDQLKAVLSSYRDRLGAKTGDLREVVRLEGCEIRLVLGGRIPDSAVDEYDRLSSKVIRLLDGYQTGDVVPLTIEEHATPTGTRFSVSQESRSHLPSSVQDVGDLTIDRTTREALETKHGDVYPLLIDLLFPPHSSAPDYFDYVRVVDGTSGEGIWRSTADATA